jgi:hypothetical protein
MSSDASEHDATEHDDPTGMTADEKRHDQLTRAPRSAPTA